jgi:hypothetical protein
MMERDSRHPIAELLYKESVKNIKKSVLNLGFVFNGKI